MRRSGLLAAALAAFVFALVGARPASAAALVGFTATSTTVAGGASVSARVQLGAGAPAGGAVVALASSNTALATVPASVTVLAGRTVNYVTVKTYAVAQPTTVHVTATFAGASQVLTLTLKPIALATLTVPASIVAGATATASVTLNGPAPSGGALVALTSSDPAVVPVPASVTVLGGRTLASFSIPTPYIAAPVTVTVIATYGGTALTKTAKVAPAALSSASFSPSSVVGPAGATGTVRLTGPAPTGGLRVALTSPNAAVGVPADVTVPAGATSATFPATTLEVTAATRVSVAAAAAGVSRSAYLTVNPVPGQPVALMVSPAVGTSGQTATGTVRLSTAAPAGGVAVALTSSDPSAAPVPASVTVAARATEARFTLTAGAVAGWTEVRLTGSAAGRTVTADWTVQTTAVTAVDAFHLLETVGPRSSLGRVRLSAAAPAGGLTLALASSNPGAVSVPASIAVAGGTSLVEFPVEVAAATARTPVTLTATYERSSASASITVVPLALIGFGSWPSTAGGVAQTGNLSVNAIAPDGGIEVALSSSRPDVAGVPPTVTVPVGQFTASFAATTFPVRTATAVRLTARLNGSVVTRDIVVQPAGLKAVVLSPDRVVNAATVTGTVTLTGDAPAGGLVVPLTGSAPTAASVPASVTVPAGGRSATFEVATTAVQAPTQITVTANLNGVGRAALLTVDPVGPAGWTWASGGVGGGRTTTNTLTLNAPAPAGGLTVAISSTDPAFSGPATVFVPEGDRTLTVTFTAAVVGQTTRAQVSASADGLSATFSATIAAVAAWVTLDQPSVRGGTTVNGTVTISDTAPAGGILVRLQSANPAAPVLATVTVPEGATAVTFTVATTPVAASQTGFISTVGLAGSGASLTVTPPGLAALSLDPAAVVGGEAATGTVTLDAPAPTGGLAVALASDHAAVAVPASVTVPAGATSATFAATTAAVETDIVATVTATLGGAQATTPLTVRTGPGPGSGLGAASVQDPATVEQPEDPAPVEEPPAEVPTEAPAEAAPAQEPPADVAAPTEPAADPPADAPPAPLETPAA